MNSNGAEPSTPPRFSFNREAQPAAQQRFSSASSAQQGVRARLTPRQAGGAASGAPQASSNSQPPEDRARRLITGRSRPLAVTGGRQQQPAEPWSSAVGRASAPEDVTAHSQPGSSRVQVALREQASQLGRPQQQTAGHPGRTAVPSAANRQQHWDSRMAELSRLTLKELKPMCAQLGLPQYGRKDEVVARIVLQELGE